MIDVTDGHKRFPHWYEVAIENQMHPDSAENMHNITLLRPNHTFVNILTVTAVNVTVPPVLGVLVADDTGFLWHATLFTDSSAYPG
jgi:hypothetical protein